METPPVSNAKFSSHVRSFAEEQLERLKSSEGQSSSCPCASASQKLDGLKNLYECLDDVANGKKRFWMDLRKRGGEVETYMISKRDLNKMITKG